MHWNSGHRKTFQNKISKKIFLTAGRKEIPALFVEKTDHELGLSWLSDP